MRGRCALPGRLLLSCCWLVGLAGCGQHHAPEATTGLPAAVLELRLVDEPAAPVPGYQRLERPAVFFDHAAHLKAVGDDCRRCHAVDEQGRFLPGLKGMVGLDQRQLLERAYHRICIGCHRNRAENKGRTGPVLCGQCHGPAPRPGPAWSEIRFDLSLHQRHALAAEKKCDRCHHVYDEKAKKLVWKKNTEGACRDCHGAFRQPQKTSLADACHRDCVACHLEIRAAKAAAGPVDCRGCHSAEQRAAIKRLEKPPRLLRGQKDRMQLHSAGVKVAAVGFDHLVHEQQASACHQCHHDTMNKCSTCHGQVAARQGGGVNRERAFHERQATASCVGCHQRRAEQGQCRGCHWRLVEVPAQRSCPVCHRPPTVVAATASAEAPVAAEPAAAQPTAPALPPASDDFPEKLEIKLLAREYRPALLPHRKIVEKLVAGVQASKLALAFHGGPETLCSGCHHHQPPGARPAPCRSCHDERGGQRRDRPNLYTAYHRQCVGCHQQLRLKQGCNDCHQPVAKEVSP